MRQLIEKYVLDKVEYSYTWQDYCHANKIDYRTQDDETILKWINSLNDNDLLYVYDDINKNLTLEQLSV